MLETFRFCNLKIIIQWHILVLPTKEVSVVYSQRNGNHPGQAATYTLLVDVGAICIHETQKCSQKNIEISI
jgi:hypothetical protein